MDPAALPPVSPARAHAIEESPEDSVQPATFEGLFTVLEAAILANKQQLNNRAGPFPNGAVKASAASGGSPAHAPPQAASPSNGEEHLATDRADVLIAQADVLIDQMSAIRLDLHAALALADGQSATNKIITAIGRLDQVIGAVRGSAAALAQVIPIPPRTPKPG